jgi:hypothetical protein
MRRLVTIDAAQTTTLNGVEGETFVVLMATSILELNAKNFTPGVLYVIILKQNYRGGHSIAWGNVANGGPANPAPYAITVNTFIADSTGTLKASLPGTWNQQ